MDVVISLDKVINDKDCVFIDVRSPNEYEDNHIVGAVNIPLLDDEERKIIGTLYKHDGKEEAVKKGFDFVSPKLKEIYEEVLKLKQKYKKIVVYCFRGGMRSRSLVDLLNGLGIECYQLEGGYKAYRTYSQNYIDKMDKDFEFIILHGGTGVGKTDILYELENQGYQVINLEDLAQNSGSVFGYLSFDNEPPTQKYFESLIFDMVNNMDKRYIFVESESKRIGRNQVPDTLMKMIANGKHILVNLNLEDRSKRLVDQYVKSSKKDDDKVAGSIESLKKRFGSEKVESLKKELEDKNYMEIARVLIRDYYDPLYQYSIDKYEYDMVLDSQNVEETVEKLMSYHETLISKGETNEL